MENTLYAWLNGGHCSSHKCYKSRCQNLGGGVKQTDICHALPSNCDLNFVFNAFIIRVAEFFADRSSEPTSVELRYPTS